MHNSPLSVWVTHTCTCMWCLRMRNFGIIGFSLSEIRSCAPHQNKIIYILWECEETGLVWRRGWLMNPNEILWTSEPLNCPPGVICAEV